MGRGRGPARPQQSGERRPWWARTGRGAATVGAHGTGRGLGGRARDGARAGRSHGGRARGGGHGDESIREGKRKGEGSQRPVVERGVLGEEVEDDVPTGKRSGEDDGGTAIRGRR